ncbi:PREDICTED: protein TIC 55, chloroplastic isoform X2 [Tarenaya hassleriana]|uniref:protein TIC 55, chloroplastic isoform X1 n=1 Tax=Tarenaya hassleriana TaxID=28532 RepID=UPI00053C350D|nr:PREDICTED: protein TIC 55, chloroplastic isoform X1 [Tarenaya hassleriana]XP_010525892.1 PREDICTED: protein TIC 55, chloroplastic isoform X2 [Tarenaya hassleriana]
MAVPSLSSSLKPAIITPIRFAEPKTIPNPFHQRPRISTKPSPRLLRRFAAVSNGSTVMDMSGGGAEVLLTLSPEEERGVDVADYDWTEEWYPLYLTRDVPDDAPLGLAVFDRKIVLYKDGDGALRCYEDRCPHRLAKLSEGQLVDGRLECLYHGWQFEGDGQCVKIPQLPANAKIPKAACVKPYEVRESQGVVWVWMSNKTPPNPEKLPWFENFARPGFMDLSSTHDLPYDHSILLENLMDPAHIPISHNRTDFTAKREDAGPLVFEVTERTSRGFAGKWGRQKDGEEPSNFLRFEAPCVLQNNREFVDKNGERQYFTGLFLCRPTGQGKSMLIVRFGGTTRSALIKLLPKWYFHQNACKVFEEDMGFLSSQNETLMKEQVPTKDLYLNLRSSDTWVAEYRKWMDRAGHGMPYHFGHRTVSPPKVPAVVEHAPAGLVAAVSASGPAKGGIGTMHAPNLSNRYFRHVIHCRSCRNVVKGFERWKKAFTAMAVALTALAILATSRQWKAVLLAAAGLCSGGVFATATAIRMNTTNHIRTHRR